MTSCQPAKYVTLPAALDANIEHKVRVCEGINKAIEIPRDGVIINALHDKMPECDVNGKTVQLEDITHSKNCMVYCARQSCDAAVQFINHHNKELDEKCEHITYLHEGALHTKADLLRDGQACHAKIRMYDENPF